MDYGITPRSSLIKDYIGFHQAQLKHTALSLAAPFIDIVPSHQPNNGISRFPAKGTLSEFRHFSQLINVKSDILYMSRQEIPAKCSHFLLSSLKK